jgi:hypothetical protein
MCSVRIFPGRYDQDTGSDKEESIEWPCDYLGETALVLGRKRMFFAFGVLHCMSPSVNARHDDVSFTSGGFERP